MRRPPLDIRGHARPTPASATGSAGAPLSDASARLKGRPGRPRKAEAGHSAGTPGTGERMNGGAQKPALARQAGALSPRILGVPAAAVYLGLSPWSIRDLITAGKLRRVPIAGRRVLLDRVDLDAFIEQAKEQP